MPNIQVANWSHEMECCYTEYGEDHRTVQIMPYTVLQILLRPVDSSKKKKKNHNDLLVVEFFICLHK